MNTEEFERIIKQILNNNLLFDFHEQLKKRLNIEYLNVTLEKLHCRYNLKNPLETGAIIIEQMDFINRQVYVRLIANNEDRIIRLKSNYNPKLK